MTVRGPDGGGVYRGENIALVHRRLSVLQDECEKQPMVLQDEGNECCVVSCDSEIYNASDVRRELIELGYFFDGSSDAEVLLKAYQQWGVGSVSRLSGVYAYAIWDFRVRRLILVRDRLGAKPLYYFPYMKGVLFSSEPKGILVNPIFNPSIDETGLIELFALASAPTPGHGIYQGLYQVKAGHIVSMSCHGMEELCYWRLGPCEDDVDYDSSCLQIRSRLESVVDHQLVKGGRVGSLLSGGLDSSVLAALAAQRGLSMGWPSLRTYSMDFKDSIEHFRSTEWHTSRDEPFAREVAEYIGAQHATVVVDPEAQLENEHVALVARDFPGWGEMDVSLYLLFKGIKPFSAVVLSGECADEIFGGYPFLQNASQRPTHTFPWLEGKVLFSSLLRSDLITQQRVQEYISDQYSDTLKGVVAMPGEGVFEAAARRVEHLMLVRWVSALLDRSDRMSMAAGVNVRIPFCDHQLIEMLHGTAPRKKYQANIEKMLLRDAAKGLLPTHLLNRKKSAFPAQVDPHYTRQLRQRVENLLSDGSAQIWELIDAKKLRSLLASAAAIPGPRAAPSMTNGLGYLIGIDAWLRRYTPQFVI